MKSRRVLGFWAIFLMPMLLFAQTHYEGNVSIGVKGGATMSRMQFNPTVPQSFQMGAIVGATFKYVEEKHFALIAEVNVEQRGWKEKFEGYDYSFGRRLTYVQIPMLTHIFFGNDRIHGFFNAGPEIGLMIATSTSSNFDYQNVASIADFPIANRNIDQFTLPIKNRFDYGISAGVGTEIFLPNLRNSFTIEGRFYYGLHDVFSNHKKDTFSGSSGMSIMVTLGYNWRIK